VTVVLPQRTFSALGTVEEGRRDVSKAFARHVFASIRIWELWPSRSGLEAACRGVWPQRMCSTVGTLELQVSLQYGEGYVNLATQVPYSGLQAIRLLS